MDFTLLIPRDHETCLGGGVYVMDGADEFPHTPNEYPVCAYILRATYGKAEAEEVAARLITLCQRAGTWAIIDYNVFWRMVMEELMSGDIQSYQVFSLVGTEMARYGTNTEDWIRAVIDVGLRFLRDNGCVVYINEVDEEGRACTLIKLLPKFFEPIEDYVTTAA